MASQSIFPTDPLLRNFVYLAWQTDGIPCHTEEILVPRGIVEIIFNFSAPAVFNGQIGNRSFGLPRCFLSGFNTRPILLAMPPHRSFFGVRLHPHAACRLLHLPAGDFVNQVVDLALVDPSMDSLWHQMIELKGFHEKISVFRNWLASRLFETDARDSMLHDFLHNGQPMAISVPDLAKKLFLSPKQLSRKLITLTGMNTEEFLLYKKYLRSITLLHHTRSSLTEIAYACHFYDQSHFIRTFRSFTQLTPGDYKKQKGPLPGHIYR